MQRWRVIGLDSQSGKGRDVVVEAATERDAQVAANELGIMVECVARHDVDKPAAETRQAPVPQPSRKPPDVYESVIQEDRPKTFLAHLASYAKFQLSLPFFSEKRRGYEERGVNTVGEIAAGVFFGLLFFSCISPVIMLFAIAFWIAWAQAMFSDMP